MGQQTLKKGRLISPPPVRLLLYLSFCRVPQIKIFIYPVSPTFFVSVLPFSVSLEFRISESLLTSLCPRPNPHLLDISHMTPAVHFHCSSFSLVVLHGSIKPPYRLLIIFTALSFLLFNPFSHCHQVTQNIILIMLNCF